MSLAQYGLYSLTGLCVVFAGLTLLMIIVKLVGYIPDREGKASYESAALASAAAPAPAEPEPALAPGSAGELKLYDTDPRDAAMVMAIVADELGKPLNELRFISIREVKQ